MVTVTNSNSGTYVRPCPRLLQASSHWQTELTFRQSWGKGLCWIFIYEFLIFFSLAFWFCITRQIYTIFSNPAFQEGEKSIPLEGFIEQICVSSTVFVGVCLQSMCVYPSELSTVLCNWITSVKWLYLSVKGLTRRNAFPVLPVEKEQFWDSENSAL